MTFRRLLPGTSIVEHQQAFNDAGGSNGAATLIYPLDKAQLDDTESSNVTYDLRVGSQYRLLSSTDVRFLEPNESLVLHKGQSALIQTEESLHVPAKCFGLVFSKVSMVQKGLANISTKIDPGYQGHLVVTVTNLSVRPLEMSRQMPFCSVAFCTVDAAANLYSKPAKAVTSLPRGGFLQQILERIEGRAASISLVSVLVNILIFGILVLQLIG